MKDLIERFKKETGWNGSFWSMDVVKDFGEWLYRNVACTGCGSDIHLRYGPNPFMDDVWNDQTPEWLCDKCYMESCDEI